MALKSLFSEEMLSKASPSSEMSLEGIAGKLTYFHEQLHLLHWQTQSYVEHQAVGGFYDYIHGFKDGIIEKLMGYTGKRPGVFKIDPLTNTTSQAVVAEVMIFASSLKMYGESNKYHDICNLADELSGESAKVKYLLTLS